MYDKMKQDEAHCIEIPNLREPPNPWARISEIAARVGVGPLKGGEDPTIAAIGADGKQYDVWSVIAAVLDRIDGK